MLCSSNKCKIQLSVLLAKPHAIVATYPGPTGNVTLTLTETLTLPLFNQPKNHLCCSLTLRVTLTRTLILFRQPQNCCLIWHWQLSCLASIKGPGNSLIKNCWFVLLKIKLRARERVWCVFVCACRSWTVTQYSCTASSTRAIWCRHDSQMKDRRCILLLRPAYLSSTLGLRFRILIHIPVMVYWHYICSPSLLSIGL